MSFTYESNIYVTWPHRVSINLQVRNVNHEIFNVQVVTCVDRPEYTSINEEKQTVYNILYKSDVPLNYQELNQIGNKLLQDRQFQTLPNKLYEVNVLNQMLNLTSVLESYKQFVLFVPEYDTYFLNYNIPNTRENDSKIVQQLPQQPLQQPPHTVVIAPQKRNGIKFCYFDSRNKFVEYGCVYTQNFYFNVFQTSLIDSPKFIQHTCYIMDLETIKFNSVSPYIGYYEILHKNGTVVVWVSSKNILISNIEERYPNTNILKRSIININSSQISVMQELTDKLKFGMLQIHDNCVFSYDTFNDTIIFVGNLPNGISRTHKNNFKSIPS